MSKLIKFEKENCPACTMVENFLNDNGINGKLAEDFNEFIKNSELKFAKFNPFQIPKIAAKFMISSVPVTILVDDEGNEIQRSRGFNPAELEQLISQL
ncbi:thioredoxin [Neobacillus vireti]|uniref:thioredoxin family protein n=1 Tax=Neobacillus vireti TaxID=220686 RepID=UPI002FFFF483